MAESGPQKASEPDPDASCHSETAEEENPAIAAFNSWGATRLSARETEDVNICIGAGVTPDVADRRLPARPADDRRVATRSSKSRAQSLFNEQHLPDGATARLKTWWQPSTRAAAFPPSRFAQSRPGTPRAGGRSGAASRTLRIVHRDLAAGQRRLRRAARPDAHDSSARFDAASSGPVLAPSSPARLTSGARPGPTPSGPNGRIPLVRHVPAVLPPHSSLHLLQIVASFSPSAHKDRSRFSRRLPTLPCGKYTKLHYSLPRR